MCYQIFCIFIIQYGFIFYIDYIFYRYFYGLPIIHFNLLNSYIKNRGEKPYLVALATIRRSLRVSATLF